MPSEYGGIENLVFIISAIMLILIAFIFTVLIAYYIRRKKLLDKQKEREKQFSQILLQSQLEIQEQTLQHISRELHDNLGQTASVIKIHLNTLNLRDINKTLEKIESTKELTRQLIGDIKALSLGLNGDRITKIGLPAAIETEATRLFKTDQFIVTFSQEGSSMPFIDNDKAVILYRMVQEVLNNVIKHSEAKQVNILIKIEENLITLVLTDDGVGFNVTEKSCDGGSGLQNLQTRARLINAIFTLDSTPGNGTKITIQLSL